MRIPDTAWRIARIALSILLMGWLFKGLNLQEVSQAAQRVTEHPYYCLLALFLTCLGLLCNSFRWHRLLHQLGYRRVTLGQSVRWVWLGQFFNAFLPGACGGDLVRGWKVVTQNGKGHRAEAAASVLIDRLFGLWVLVIWSSLLLFLHRTEFSESPEWKWVATFMWILGSGGLLAPALIQILPTSLTERLHPLLGRVHTAFRESLRAPRTVMVACLGSLGNLLCLTLAAYCFALALDAEITARNMLILFPTITVLTSIPLTPGALGIRENLLALLGPAFGLPAEPAVVLSLLVYLSGILVGAIGGGFFIADRRERLASEQT